MGQTCTTCNTCKGQEGKLEFETDYVFFNFQHLQKNRAAYNAQYPNENQGTTNSIAKGSPDQIVAERTKNVPTNADLQKNVIKLQALYRGHAIRKKLKEQGEALGSSAQKSNTKGSPEDENLEYVENYKFPNGAIYTGQWKNGTRHGFGTQIWPDGAKYEGEWLNNQAHGKGKFWHIDGDIFEGEWKNDKANGHGVYMHKNGAKYEGEWKDDFQHGKGTETWADNSKYQGDYKNGKKDGTGIYFWADGSQYSGEWVDNKINGRVFFNKIVL